MTTKRSEGKDKGRSNCPLTTSKARRAEADKLAASVQPGFPPGMSQPALRALAGAGISTLEQLTKVRVDTIAALHGMGPKGIRILREALESRGLTFLP